MRSNLYTLGEFTKMAMDYAGSLIPLPNQATVVGLYGDLGSGKTTFTQAVAKALGVSAPVTSPTFLIMKSYILPSTLYHLLVHVDAYRLKNPAELRKLHFDELLADPRNLIFVEWADKVTDLLPTDHQKLYLEFIDEHTRGVRA